MSNTDAGGASGGGEQPKPGLYNAEVHEITLRDDRGEGKETDLQIIYRILGDDGKPDMKYNRIWDYVGLERETTEWKRAQFFEALGVASEDKRTGEFDPTKFCMKFNGDDTNRTKGYPVKLRIKADSYNGQYKGKVAAVLAMPDAGDGGGSSEDDPFA